jgi:hypothetical protein
VGDSHDTADARKTIGNLDQMPRLSVAYLDLMFILAHKNGKQ